MALLSRALLDTRCDVHTNRPQHADRFRHVPRRQAPCKDEPLTGDDGRKFPGKGPPAAGSAKQGRGS